MRLLVHFIYYFTKTIAYLGIRIFYHPVVVIDREKHFVDNPAIMVSNHPNTLVDPFNGGVWIRRKIFFLANSNMFASYWGNLFFSNVHCIPIQRRTDKHSVNNADSFRKVNDFLSNGGLLWVAPEGGSERGRRLRPFKSGAAWIAFDAEKKNNWELDLVLLPVGITYESPSAFRTQSTSVFGAPIQVKDYRQVYEKDAKEAVRRLMEEVKTRMQSLIVNTEDETQATILHRIETVYQNENPLSGRARFYQSQGLAKELQFIQKNHLNHYQQIDQQLADYFKHLTEGGINDRAVYDLQNKHPFIPSLILLLLGLPVFIYGFLNNILPALFPLLILRKISFDPTYYATVKIIGGLIFYPFFWLLQAGMLYYFTNQIWLVIFYLITLYPLGILAWEYYQSARQFLKSRRLRHFDKSRQNELIKMRAEMWKAVKEMI